MIVQVEFCTGCGYYQKFADLSAELTKAFPDIDVIANHIPPRMKSFEISLDNKLIFSKLKSDRLPEPGEIVKLVEERTSSQERLRKYSSVAVALGMVVVVAALCLRYRSRHQ